MVDIHSHIINEIDDGSKSIDMTINMLKKSEQSGTTDIIATPHFMRGRFEVEYKDVVKKVEELKGDGTEKIVSLKLEKAEILKMIKESDVKMLGINDSGSKLAFLTYLWKEKDDDNE